MIDNISIQCDPDKYGYTLVMFNIDVNGTIYSWSDSIEPDYFENANIDSTTEITLSTYLESNELSYIADILNKEAIWAGMNQEGIDKNTIVCPDNKGKIKEDEKKKNFKESHSSIQHITQVFSKLQDDAKDASSVNQLSKVVEDLIKETEKIAKVSYWSTKK